VKPIQKSNKLQNVCYDIRGPVLEKAKQMEEEGHKIIKLNIGNLAVFGFDAPEEIQQDMMRNLPNSAGYSDSKGIFAARKAIMHYTQEKKIQGVELDDIYVGNGASELIVMSMNALLNSGDEVLVPAPDYPLWTAAVSLSGGTPVHYVCDEANEWMPDLDDIRRKITPNTRAIVVINPNNPTGALYSDELLQAIVTIAREHGLIIFADEIYDKVLYDGNEHTSIGSLSTDVLTVTFNGLSKNYRSCGYRAGWMVVSGDKRPAQDYMGDPDRAGRLPEHQRPRGRGRPPAPPARPGARADHADPRNYLRQAQGGAVPVPEARPVDVPDPGRPGIHLRIAAGVEGAAGAGHGLQLGRPGPFPDRVPAARGRPARGRQPRGALP
jgi:histidinol-phosphate/aromatic aminotransferase/cobyric acid decarboxylase-like protein